MPYNSVDDLPKQVKDNLGEHEQKIFLAAFNSAWEGTCKDRDDKEECAFKIAWSAAKKPKEEELKEEVVHELMWELPRNELVDVEGGGLLIKNVPLLVEGAWTDSTYGTPLYYSAEELKSATWGNHTHWCRHGGGVPRRATDKIGETRNEHYDDAKKAIIGDVFYHGLTQMSRDMIALVKATPPIINWISMELHSKDIRDPKEKRTNATRIKFIGSASVDRGACEPCKLRTHSELEDQLEKKILEELKMNEEEKAKELEAAKADLEKKLAEANTRWEAAEKRSTDLEKRIETIEKTAKAQTQITSTTPIIIPSYGVKIDRKSGTVTRE